MVNLTQEQIDAWANAFYAWANAYNTAKELGQDDAEAVETALRWAEETDFGKKPRPYSYDLRPKRPQKPSSDIEEKIAAAAHAYDPTLRTVIFSGQETPLGVGQMSRGLRAKYNRLIAQGYPKETAARMARAEIHGTSLGRHPHGVAADVYFEDITGARLPRNKESQETVDGIAFNFVQSTGGNWGRGGNNYMEKGTAHLDTAPLSPYAPGHHWGDVTEGSRLAYQQAKALHEMDITDASMVPIPVPRKGIVTEHPPDAMGFPDLPKSNLGGGRSDYPTGPLNPEPWQDSFAPAPSYPPPQAAPAISDERQAAAYRALADGLTTAGVRSIGGAAAVPPMDVPVPRARPGGSGPITPPIPAPRPYRTGPKRQIFDILLRNLLDPRPQAK